MTDGTALRCILIAFKKAYSRRLPPMNPNLKTMKTKTKGDSNHAR